MAVADLSREESKRLRAALAEEADHPRRTASGFRVRAAGCRAWADSLPENRLHGIIAGKLYTYARDARVRRWSNGIEITGIGPPA
jgi:hypothetical protein